ncbi:hypothetical protein [Glaciecola sp. 1036]|uniref:hypothetical protein n=1 Tax=Alteromonadaceae TaxID=72275 RepID=UPI003CFBCA43
MKSWLYRESLFSNEKALILFTCLASINALVGIYGIYWVYFGGNFGYEGGYFIALSVFISPIFVPVFIYYFLWPKPVKKRALLAITCLPYGGMLACALFFNFYY